MRDHALDVLIGTQIIAKGHHFPDLTLVGVVDADLGLGGGDLRAAERSSSCSTRWRAAPGARSGPGRVLIQTHLPEHPVMQALAAGDKDRFYAEELAERRTAGHAAVRPPRRPDRGRPRAERDPGAPRALARERARLPGLRVLGPAPAPLALLRGRYRQRLLVNAAPGVDLPAVLRAWLKGRGCPAACACRSTSTPTASSDRVGTVGGCSGRGDGARRHRSGPSCTTCTGIAGSASERRNQLPAPLARLGGLCYSTGAAFEGRCCTTVSTENQSAGSRGTALPASSAHASGLAGRYAVALFELAQEQDALDRGRRRSAAICARCSPRAPICARLIRSPVLSREDQGAGAHRARRARGLRAADAAVPGPARAQAAAVRAAGDHRGLSTRMLAEHRARSAPR